MRAACLQLKGPAVFSLPALVPRAAPGGPLSFLFSCGTEHESLSATAGEPRPWASWKKEGDLLAERTCAHGTSSSLQVAS